jgi:hypothetical protein
VTGLLGLAPQGNGITVLTFDGLPIATMTATVTATGHTVTVGGVGVIVDPVTYRASDYATGMRETTVGEHPYVLIEDGEPTLSQVAAQAAAAIDEAEAPSSDMVRYEAISALLGTNPLTARVGLYTDGLIYVVLAEGCRADREAAEQVAEDLGNHGYPAHVITVAGARDHIFEVQVPPHV